MARSPPVFDLHEGASPLLVSIPHDGRHVPDAIFARLTPEAALLPDTDWHLRRLYNFLDVLDATVIAANVSRTVIDLNRPPDGAALYPGRAETSLCPVQTFDGDPVYRAQQEPDEAEIAERLDAFWRPYHDAVAAQIARVRDLHGYALLWDAHSIRSQVPRLFEGGLPDLNLGSAGGASCGEEIAEAVFAKAEASGYSSVHNGRFKGGHITRNYGRPGQGVHALQMELAQANYMDEGEGFAFDEAGAIRLRPALKAMLSAFVDSAQSSSSAHVSS